MRKQVAATIAPSMLSSDFARLAEEAARMVQAGADWLHMDLMDGHFVPNLSIGPPVVRSLRRHTQAYLDCHLMVSEPGKWVEDLREAGASQMTFHLETVRDQEELGSLIHRIKEAGMDVGIAIKPDTSAEESYALVYPFLSQLNMILVMTVEPGFGGQSFMSDMMPKVQYFRTHCPDLNIQVDGGLSTENVLQAAQAGANIIVAGSSIFRSADPEQYMALLRKSVQSALNPSCVQ